MDEHIRASAVEAARQLLQGYRQAWPTWLDNRTPIEALLEWLGLAVETFHPDDYVEGTYGWLEPGEDLIWLRRGLPETLRRFTLAHELGHVVLHRPHSPLLRTLLPHFEPPALAFEEEPLALLPASDADPCHEVDVQEDISTLADDPFQELLGIGQTYSPRSQREQAANIFAAELLMPLERVRSLYLERLVPAQRLAATFEVSQTAMLNRLTGLLSERATPIAEPEVAVVEVEEVAPSPPAKKVYDTYQQAAIEAATPALIVAGPGSGKTSTLIGRVEHLIQVGGLAPQQILALTFSRKAAEEMQERLQIALRVRADEPLSPWNAPTVSTFHSFCAELLRRYSSLVGLRPDFAFIDDTEGYFLLRRLASSLPLKHYHHLTTPTLYFPDILRAISRAKDELVTPEQYRQLGQQMLAAAEADEQEEERVKALRTLEVAAVYAMYQQELRRRGDCDFGGLLMLAVELLETHPEVRVDLQRQYQQILVDEFQDINRASGVLLRLLAGETRRVWVVGDANQAIYGFRGASPANIVNFRDDYPGAVVLPLSRNYRSRPDIVGLAESFRLRLLQVASEETLRNEAAREAPPEPYVTVAAAEDEASELAGLVADIRYKLTQGFSYQDLVVLCRTRALARKVSRALAAAHLPIIESGGTLEQEHVKDLLAIVLLLADLGGMGIIRAARQSEHPFSQAEVEALLLEAHTQQLPPGLLFWRGVAPAGLSVTGRRSLTRLSEILNSLTYASDLWSLLAQYLFIETSNVRNLLQVTGEERTSARQVLADYANTLQLARRYDQQQRLLRMHDERAAAEAALRASAENGEAQSGVAEPRPGANTRPSLQEQAQGFIDYLEVLLRLRQDSGNRQQGTEEEEARRTQVIRVMTVHASKGLEFPVIYLPGLMQQRFPSMRHHNPVAPPTGMLPAEGGEAAVHEIGEACLFYVGVTRAREQLVLSYSERQGKRAAKPSTFLDPLLAGLPPERVTRLRWQESAAVEDLELRTETLLPSSQPGEEFIAKMQSLPLSASAVETYQNCPRKYAYGQLYRFQRADDAYYLFLQATRKTIESLHQQSQSEPRSDSESAHTPARLPSKTETRELYTRHWEDLGGHEVPFAPLYEQHGQEIADLMRRKLVERREENWELRQTFEVEIVGQVIHVEIDRVEAPSEEGQAVRFVRTRFGRRKQEPDPGTRELLYTLAYRARYPTQPLELYYDNLTTGETTRIKLTERKEQSLYAKLEEGLRQQQLHMYPAVPAEPARCPTCPFYLICPA